MKITLTPTEKEEMQERFKDEGSTPDIINTWLDYEARLLEKEKETVFSDFLRNRNAFDEINEDDVQETLENMK